MILIADAGGTKTDWTVMDGSRAVARIATQGINPFHQDAADIGGILADELLPQMRAEAADMAAVYFYGSGCTPDKSPAVQRCLGTFFAHARQLEVDSDLLGAARAVCGRERGMACILGTGSNSCLYDGQRINEHIPALGYILGDEGSGAALGKMFLNAIYKNLLSRMLKDAYERFSGLTQADVVERVYGAPMANRFLASVSQFVSLHIDVPELQEMVIDNFRLFFQKNIKPYQQPDLKLGVVGGMAVHYRQQLEEAARMENIRLGTIVKSPMEGLIRYHSWLAY